MKNFLIEIGLKKITPGYSSFSKGKRKSFINLKFNNKNIKPITLICYEIIFPHLLENKKKILILL